MYWTERRRPARYRNCSDGNPIIGDASLPYAALSSSSIRNVIQSLKPLPMSLPSACQYSVPENEDGEGGRGTRHARSGFTPTLFDGSQPDHPVPRRSFQEPPSA